MTAGVGSNAGVAAAAALSTRHSSGHCPWTSPMAITLIMLDPPSSATLLEQRTQTAVQLAGLLGGVAVVARYQLGGLLAETLGLQAVEESFDHGQGLAGRFARSLP